MTYQIGLCDDEVYQLKVNDIFLKEIAKKNDMELECHGFQNGAQLKRYLVNKKLDVLFLDIDLGSESGIDLAAQLSRKYPKIIIAFITGHKEFMEDAFELDAMGYLMKPFEMKRMERVLNRALLQVSALEQRKKERELVITFENLKRKIKCRDIVYVQKQQSRSIIVTNTRQFHVYEPISSLYERLGEDFIRVNQGEIVNVECIKGIEGNMVKMTNQMEMSIGRTFKKEVIKKYFNKE